MPSNRQSNPNRQIAAIHRVIDSRLKPNMTLARVVSVPPHGNTALIRIGGSATLESAEVLGDLKLQPNDTVIIIRPEQSAWWFILSAYTQSRSGTAPRVPSGVTKIAAPGNVTLAAGAGFNLLTWETPPSHPNLSYQVEAGDAPEMSEDNTIYQVRGSVFLDVLAPGTVRSYRVLCVDDTWNKSGWSDWHTTTAGGGVLVGAEAEIPAAPVGIYFATDTDTLYVGDGAGWNAITGGGSGGHEEWDPDTAPELPSVYDDEFNTGSLDGKWSEYNPSTTGYDSPQSTTMALVLPDGGQNRFYGLCQDIDLSGDFTIVTRVRRNHEDVHGCAGIALYEDPTDSGAAVYCYGLYKSGFVQSLGVFTNAGIGLGGSGSWDDTAYVYVRVRYDASEDLLIYEMSVDGISWSASASGPAPFTPAAMGIMIARSDDGGFTSAYFDFFRYRDTFDSLSDPVYGDGDPIVITDHGALTGLGDDDHPQYHNDTRGDARYYRKTEFVDESEGISSAGKPIVLDADGLVALSMLPATAGSGVSALADLSDVDTTTAPPTDGQALIWDGAEELWVPGDVEGGSGAASFIELTDTPEAYVANKWVKVNVAGDALEWTDAPSGGGGGTSFYDPNVPPETPGIYDDEFNDGAIDVAWSYNAPDADFDINQTNGAAHISEGLYPDYLVFQSDTVSRSFTPPVNQAFTLVFKAHAGVRGDVNERYLRFAIVGQSVNHELSIRLGRFDNDNNAVRMLSKNGGAESANGASFGSTGPGPIYILVSHNGSKNFTVYWSRDGLIWSYVGNVTLSNLSSFTKFEFAAGTQFFSDNRNQMAALDFVRYFDEEKVYKIGGLASAALGGGGGATNFVDLDDVPSNYVDQAGKTLVVKATEDGLEFSSAGATPVHQAVFTVVGDVEVVTHPILIPNLTGAAKTILRVGLVTRTGPVGADLVVNVKVGGVSIWDSSADYVKIAAGQTSGETSTIDNPSWGTGAADALEVEVTQIGSATPGADLAIIVVYS